MRVNVHSEKLTDLAKFRKRLSRPPDSMNFFEISFYLASPEELHHGTGDDEADEPIEYARKCIPCVLRA